MITDGDRCCQPGCPSLEIGCSARRKEKVESRVDVSHLKTTVGDAPHPRRSEHERDPWTSGTF